MSDEKFSDRKAYCNSKISISLNAIPLAAENIAKIIFSLRGSFKKCVILDLDNTLWGGVIGDDGLENIEIGELGIGYAFTDFQLWLKQLKNRGILLCVCSKNDEAAAKEPFIKHEDMVLRLDDFVMFVANWNDKATNIRYIQSVLNIGMDSFVFIDDNAFERNLVRESIPEITVPEMPEDPVRYRMYLESLNLFETTGVSKNDAERTAQYQAEANRTVYMSSFSDISEYLESLEMVGEQKPFEKQVYSRIAQLTQRSNQFNLRTVRYTENDIERIADDPDYITRYFTLKDKFGNHGLVSVVIMKKDGDSLFIDTWLMSCRVLKRGMEEFVVNSIVKTAVDNGCKTIIGEYIPTAKNSMVKDIYGKFGFKSSAENKYLLETAEYKPADTKIKENNGGNSYD